MKISNPVLFSLFISTFLSLATAAEDAIKPIQLHYAERPPYSMTIDNKMATGLLVTPVEKAFKKAKVPFTWVATPINRQFQILKDNKAEGAEKHCAVGAYKIPEREEFANFSEPYYKSKGLVAVVSRKRKKAKYKNLEEFMSHYTILMKENYTCGDQVEKILKKINPSKVTTAGDAPQMIKMISENHGDYLIISLEEIEYYFKNGGADPKKLEVIKFPEISMGLYRYFMCSKSIDLATLAKVNKAIDFEAQD